MAKVKKYYLASHREMYKQCAIVDNTFGRKLKKDGDLTVSYKANDFIISQRGNKRYVIPVPLEGLFAERFSVQGVQFSDPLLLFETRSAKRQWVKTFGNASLKIRSRLSGSPHVNNFPFGNCEWARTINTEKHIVRWDGMNHARYERSGVFLFNTTEPFPCPVPRRMFNDTDSTGAILHRAVNADVNAYIPTAHSGGLFLGARLGAQYYEFYSRLLPVSKRVLHNDSQITIPNNVFITDVERIFYVANTVSSTTERNQLAANLLVIGETTKVGASSYYKYIGSQPNSPTTLPPGQTSDDTYWLQVTLPAWYQSGRQLAEGILSAAVTISGSTVTVHLITHQSRYDNFELKGSDMKYVSFNVGAATATVTTVTTTDPQLPAQSGMLVNYFKHAPYFNSDATEASGLLDYAVFNINTGTCAASYVQDGAEVVGVDYQTDTNTRKILKNEETNDGGNPLRYTRKLTINGTPYLTYTTGLKRGTFLRHLACDLRHADTPCIALASTIAEDDSSETVDIWRIVAGVKTSTNVDLNITGTVFPNFGPNFGSGSNAAVSSSGTKMFLTTYYRIVGTATMREVRYWYDSVNGTPLLVVTNKAELGGDIEFFNNPFFIEPRV